MLSCTQENHDSGRYMQNRELSWLQFNERCMRQAKDPGNPLLERLRFLSIFTSNLDEFFMVRVGSLIDMLPLGKKYTDDKTGETAEEQLAKIYDQVRILYAQRDAIYQELEKEFRIKGVFWLKYNEMTASEQEYVENYFSNSVLPMLSPMLVNPQHPFPHLSNKGTEICVRLRKKKGEEYFAFLPVPVDLPQILYLPGPGVRYIGMEDLLLELADVVFDTYTVEEKIQICITRNADIHAEDEDCEKNEDFRKVMQKLLKDRRRLAPLRLEMTDHPSSKMLKFLQSRLLLSDSQIFYTSGPLQMKYAYGLENKLNPEQKKEMLFESYTPKIPGELAGKESMFERIRKQDRLLSYPYESMKPFLRLLEEAASDPDVRSIQITIYRLAGKSKLVKYLCRAAENGKKVTVLIELRARFDEQNNIDWSKEFEKSGCTIMYGMANFKVHSKLCLITRNERGNPSSVHPDRHRKLQRNHLQAVHGFLPDDGRPGNRGGRGIVFPEHGHRKPGRQIRPPAGGTAGAAGQGHCGNRAGDAEGVRRISVLQAEFPDGPPHHREVAGRFLRRRKDTHDRARHLLPGSGHPGRDGKHRGSKHRGPVSGAFTDLCFWQGLDGKDVHRLSGFYDAKHSPKSGSGMSDSRPGGSGKNMESHPSPVVRQYEGHEAAAGTEVRAGDRRRKRVQPGGANEAGRGIPSQGLHIHKKNQKYWKSL